jgi:hypothetical protein
VNVVIYSVVKEQAFVLNIERCDCGNVKLGDGICVCVKYREM